MSHRPILKFDSAERWRPLEVGAFFAESRITSPQHRICPAKGHCTEVIDDPEGLSAGAVLDVAGNRRDGRDYVMPQPGTCSRPKRVVDCDSGPRSAIYYEVKRIHGLVAIDYWWFLRYNDYPYESQFKCRNFSFSPCHDHEGDWEGVRVLFRASRPHDIQVRFDAHGRSEQYDKLEPERVGDRPVVYVALGTHASYPRACTHVYCVQTGERLPDGRYDGHSDWGRNSRAQCGSTCLLPLPPDSWATWPGRWGRRCHSSTCVRAEGPRSPGVQSRSHLVNSNRTVFRSVSHLKAYRLLLARLR
jgi:hypothetical protein